VNDHDRVSQSEKTTTMSHGILLDSIRRNAAPMSVPPPPSNSTFFSDATRWTAWTFASVGITTTSPNARVISKIMPRAFARSLSLIL
jgi:hypothetical protein